MAIARANGKLKGKQPKLSSHQRVHVLKLVAAGDHTIAEFAELFAVSRATISREIARARSPQTVRSSMGICDADPKSARNAGALDAVGVEIRNARKTGLTQVATASVETYDRSDSGP
jgi:predicted RNA polymerase sigma factor